MSNHPNVSLQKESAIITLKRARVIDSKQIEDRLKIKDYPQYTEWNSFEGIATCKNTIF